MPAANRSDNLTQIETAVRAFVSGLQSSRQFILPTMDDQPHDDAEDFELVTWLVLHPS